MHEQISRLESCSGWMARRKAARALRKYDWKCHPEAAEALAGALLNDDCGLVRQEAAESLCQNAPVPCRGSRGGRPGGEVRRELPDPLLGQESAEITGQGLCGYLLDLRARQPCRGGRVAALGPALSALPMDSAVEPLPPGQMVVPSNPSEVSPFSPSVSPPLPSPAPGSGSLLSPDPARGPFGKPSLPVPVIFPVRRPTWPGHCRGAKSEAGPPCQISPITRLWSPRPPAACRPGRRTARCGRRRRPRCGE